MRCFDFPSLPMPGVAQIHAVFRLLFPTNARCSTVSPSPMELGNHVSPGFGGTVRGLHNPGNKMTFPAPRLCLTRCGDSLPCEMAGSRVTALVRAGGFPGRVTASRAAAGLRVRAGRPIPHSCCHSARDGTPGAGSGSIAPGRRGRCRHRWSGRPARRRAGR